METRVLGLHHSLPAPAGIIATSAPGLSARFRCEMHSLPGSKITGSRPVMTRCISVDCFPNCGVGDTQCGSLSPDPVQGAAIGLEPGLGLVRAGAQLVGELPEPVGMVQLAQVRNLMGGEVVEHEGRRHDETPGEAERPV